MSDLEYEILVYRDILAFMLVTKLIHPQAGSKSSVVKVAGTWRQLPTKLGRRTYFPTVLSYYWSTL